MIMEAITAIRRLRWSMRGSRSPRGFSWKIDEGRGRSMRPRRGTAAVGAPVRFGDWIITGAAPGMAPQEPPPCQPDAGEDAVAGDRLARIFGAAGQEAARWRQQRRDQPLIGADAADAGGARESHFSLLSVAVSDDWSRAPSASRYAPRRCKPVTRSATRSSKDRVRVPARAMTT